MILLDLALLIVVIFVGPMILIDRHLKRVYGVRKRVDFDRGFEVIQKDGR